MADPQQTLPAGPVVTTAPIEENPVNFIMRAKAAGLTSVEINDELKARYEIDLSPIVDIGETASRVFRSGVPKGMREKTYAEEIMEPISVASGMAAGAVTGAAELITPQITETIVPGRMGKVIAESQRKPLGKELRKLREDIDKTFREREGESGFENLRLDLRENAEGVIEIMRVLRGAEDFTKEHKSTLEHLWGKQKEGSVTGRQFVMGAAADIWALGDDPELYFKSRPFTAAMMLAAPMAEVNALAKAGYQPAVNFVKSKSGQALKRISDSASKKLGEYETGVRAKQTVQKTARTIEEGLQKARRWTSDPFIQSTEKASKLTEALVDTANRTGKSVQQIAARWAESIRRGYEEVAPGRSKGIRLPFKKVEEAVGTTKAAERWDTPDSIKVLTQEVDYNPTTAHFGGRREIAAILAEALEDFKAGKISREDYDNFVKHVYKQEAKPSFITISRTHWNEAVGRFVEDLAKLKHVDPITVIKTLNKTLADQAVGMLRSKNIQKQVIDSIMAKIEEAGIYSPEQMVNLRKQLPKYLDEFNKRDPNSPSYEAHAIIDFSGTKINLSQEVLSVIDNNPNLRKNIYSELISEAAGDIAQDTRLNAISESLNDNMPMFATEAEWIDNAIERSLIGGEELPPLIQDNPHHLATRMIDNLDGYAKLIAKSDDPAMMAQARQQIRNLAHKLRSYKRMPPELTKAFGIQDYIATNKPLIPPKTKVGKAPAKLEYEVFAPEGVIDTLQWELNSKLATENATGFWNILNRAIKGNLTARNLASALNNIKANFVYQTMRRGTPLLTSDLMNMIRKYHGYRTGKSLRGDMAYKLSPFERKFFEAMERSGVLDTTMLDAELGGLGISDIMPVLKKFTPMLEKFYKAGDNIFKLEESMHNYKRLTGALDELLDGEFISFEVQPNKHVKLVKQGDNFTLDGQVLTSSQVDDLLVSGSSLPAQRIFFDYTNVPNAIKWVRASKALGVTSPFFTWFWKAMDIPGVKRGLMREALTDGVSFSTNNKKINTMRRAVMVKNVLKRHAFIAGLREAVKEPNNSETLRKVLAYSPKEFNLQLLDYTTNPMWIGHDSEESSNQFAPSDIIIRAIMSGMALTESDQDIIEELYPKEHGRFGEEIDFDLSSIEDPKIRNDILIRRKLLRKHHTKEGLTAEDLAQLIGVSGSPILDGVIMLKEGSRQGGKINKAKLTQMITTALMGGTAAGVLDIAVGAITDPNSPNKLFTTRRWAENEIGEPEEKFIKWAMRRLTGIGFRPLDVGQRSESYFKRKEFEWKDSLTGDLKDLLKDNPDLRSRDRANIQARIIELEKIVEGEMMIEKLRFDEVFENLRKNVKSK
jgi:hypothetical protein